MAWDWEYVGELIVGIAVGNIVGWYIGVRILRLFFYEVMSHPTVQKFAGVAERLKGFGNRRGGLWGLVDRGLEMFGPAAVEAFTKPPTQ